MLRPLTVLNFIRSKQAQQKNGQDLDSTSDDNDQLTKTGRQTIF